MNDETAPGPDDAGASARAKRPTTPSAVSATSSGPEATGGRAPADGEPEPARTPVRKPRSTGRSTRKAPAEKAAPAVRTPTSSRGPAKKTTPRKTTARSATRSPEASQAPVEQSAPQDAKTSTEQPAPGGAAPDAPQKSTPPADPTRRRPVAAATSPRPTASARSTPAKPSAGSDGSDGQAPAHTDVQSSVGASEPAVAGAPADPVLATDIATDVGRTADADRPADPGAPVGTGGPVGSDIPVVDGMRGATGSSVDETAPAAEDVPAAENAPMAADLPDPMPADAPAGTPTAPAGTPTAATDPEPSAPETGPARPGARGAAAAGYARERFAALVGPHVLRREKLPYGAALEVGAGSTFGFSLGLLQARVVRRLWVSDLDSSALTAAQRRSQQLGLRIEQSELADPEMLPFPDASFDLVVAHALLHRRMEPGRTLAEIIRVLRPGGRFVITGESTRARDWASPGFAREQGSVGRVGMSRAGRARVHLPGRLHALTGAQRVLPVVSERLITVASQVGAWEVRVRPEELLATVLPYPGAEPAPAVTRSRRRLAILDGKLSQVLPAAVFPTVGLTGLR